MSFSNPYEYMHGEFQDVTRVPLAAAGVAPAWIIDPNGVKIAGHQIELWDAETGGTRLLEGADYSLVFLDTGKTAAEGVDIWAGYQIINVAYQGIPLYLTARIIGGYTKYAEGRIIFDEAVGDQRVTKWDTGRMEICGTNTQTVASTLGPDPYVGYYGENNSVYFAEAFSDTFESLALTPWSDNISVFFPTMGVQLATLFQYRVRTASSNASFSFTLGFHAVGRWK